MEKMTNAEAIETLRANYPDACFEQLREAVDKAIEALEAQDWIPCSKRLPQNELKTYWICTETGSQHECRWTNNRYGIGESDTWGWYIFDIPQFTEVVAWMPLPEPYKAKSEEV